MFVPAGIILLTGILLLPVSTAVHAAERDRAGASHRCAQPKALREVAQDEVATMAELCRARAREK